MAFPPHYLANMPMNPMNQMFLNMGQNQFQMPPMGGIMPMGMGMGIPPPHHQQHGMSAVPTLPTGVASISAPPVRNIASEMPSLLGVYPGMQQMNPMAFQHMQFQQQMMQTNNHTKKPPQPTGPVITVFVGNITERAPDMLVRQLLSKCGVVANWKRAQGASGKIQAFGFCDFADPDSAMRAIRILNDLDIAEKKLVVKAGAEAKEKLEEYVKKKNPSAKADDPVDEATKRDDKELRSQISAILREHELELTRDPNPNRDQTRQGAKRTGDASKQEGLEGMEMEEEKRSLIHREIDKFRDTYKAYCYNTYSGRSY